MGETVSIAVPRKGRPLEAVLDRLAAVADVPGLADDISSTLRHEKALTKGTLDSPSKTVYERLAEYSSVADPTAPEYTVYRDDRDGKPRRIVFDSVRIPLDDADCPSGTELHLVGREEPFRALRTHEFALGFDSADLVLEEVVELRADPLEAIAAINDRIDPADTDVRVVSGLGDTVYHTLLATPETVPAADSLDRSLLTEYEGRCCIEPRYERLVQAVLGTEALEGITFAYPDPGRDEEAAIADTGLGVYLTMTGSTARRHGLVIGEQLFPSETVLLENAFEVTEPVEAVRSLVMESATETELPLEP